MRYLASELESRDPKDSLSDIECGHYLEALSKLPGNTRQLIEDSDMRVDLEEIEGRYRVVKILKKREPEFLQVPGQEDYIYRVSEGSPEDVFNSEECELVPFQEEEDKNNYTPRMDTWDVVFDATEFLRTAKNILKSDLPVVLKKKIIQQASENLIYSADYFPYPALNRKIQSKAAKLLEKEIELNRFNRNKIRGLIQNSGVSQSEKTKLWKIWQEDYLRKNGSVKLTSWQFEKALTAKLQRQGLSGKEIKGRVNRAMKKLYGKG